jgi:hypothetical protein
LGKDGGWLSCKDDDAVAEVDMLDEQWPLAMPLPGECAVHLRTPAMAVAPREGATTMAVRERARWKIEGEGAARGYT